MPAVTYHLEPDLTSEEFIDLLVRSTLAARRPVHDLDTMGHLPTYSDGRMAMKPAIIILSLVGGFIMFIIGAWCAGVRISGSSAGGPWVIFEAGPLVTTPIGLILGGFAGWMIARKTPR